jgi:hypothetical protein
MDIKIKDASITYVLKEDSEVTITMEQSPKTGEYSYEFSSDYVKFEDLKDMVELIEDFKSRIEE